MSLLNDINVNSEIPISDLFSLIILIKLNNFKKEKSFFFFFLRGDYFRLLDKFVCHFISKIKTKVQMIVAPDASIKVLIQFCILL